MLSSLRARVLIWYTALLGLVILTFGAVVCLVAWRARLADVDADLYARAHALAGALEPAGDGTFDLTLPSDPAAPPLPAGPPRHHVLWTAEGHVIDQSDPTLDVPHPAAPLVRTRAGLREVVVTAASGPTVLVGRSVADVRAEIGSLAARMAAVGLVALALAAGGGWLLVGSALRPIDRISATARAMTGGDFTARIPLAQVESELGQLAQALNEAFDRLHAALERQKRFTADASHELRTPLATMSTELQWVLGRDRDRAEYRESLDVCRRAVDRMAAIVERLLTLARAEAAPALEQRERVRVDDLVAAVVDEVARLAEPRAVAIRFDRVPVTVAGDPDRLRDAITNVVVNAVQYSADRATVHVTLRQDEAAAVLEVLDTGIGIAADDLARIFEPFFRADPARSRVAGGAGLGLAVARAHLVAHGGTIALASAPGAGTRVTIRLPVAARA
ncbi:MAG TPA: HAMP domain-containing sensor histidine kinase [Vicinamibacterales bacterium]|nr:HAMP domain-containing sensor histidine kinase [Vicinamibacterales bacterium]